MHKIRILTLAAVGIEGLIRNNGTIRLVIGCTLGEQPFASTNSPLPQSSEKTSHPHLPKTRYSDASYLSTGKRV